MGYQLTHEGAQLILQAVRGAITREEIRRKVSPRRLRQQVSCQIGAYGVCLTHGQVSVECEKEP